jgi:cyclopropane fatty-acyl-phospholipid synthase-like methyltransferase
MPRSWKSAEISAFIATVAGKLKPDARSILDLGVGDGDLAPMLMDRFRGVSLRGIDRDETRLGLVEGRLGFYEGKVELAYGDMLQVPLGSGHDLAASAAALRHIAPAEKHRLYSRVHQALAADGLFLFGDRVKIASPRIVQAVRELRADEMAAAGASGPPADYRSPDSRERESIADTLYALRKAAFHEVECLYCYGDRAVFAGFK